MTRAEYDTYTARVAEFFAREKIEFPSTGTAETPGGEDHGAWFSWRACECCLRKFGGMREYLYGQITLESGEKILQTWEVCEDCIYFIEYGKLSDSVMLEVEKSENKGGK